MLRNNLSLQRKWQIKAKIKTTVSGKNEAIMKQLLENRGLKTKKEIDEFLNPQDPYTIPIAKTGIAVKEITKAVERIKKAIVNKEQIVIYGDYDADGICATAILWETLFTLKAKVAPFIPLRESLGYGLKKEGIDQIIKKYQPQLIITVDNGIVAHSGIVYAKKKKIDVIISDHHQPPKKLPQAQAIIWSDKISGSGVAWFLALKIWQLFKKPMVDFKSSASLELAAIGTVTDLMPVFKISRSILKYGFLELRLSRRPGIIALCRQANIFQKEIDSFEVGYILGPRLNAMGRLDDALESLRLLCTNDLGRAQKLAETLGSTNADRRLLTQTTFDHALKKAEKLSQKKPIILLADKTYSQGVIGLVAGKLVEEFYRPAIVISIGKDYAKGSVRSVKGFNMIKSLRQHEELFEDLGGHPMAAGFTIKNKLIKKLEAKLANVIITKDILQPKIEIDLALDLKDITKSLVSELENFSPFGLGNPKPLFYSEAKILSYRTVGREQNHLKIKVQSIKSSLNFEAIAFGWGYLFPQLSKDQILKLCYSIEKNHWNGNNKIELKIKDVKA